MFNKNLVSIYKAILFAVSVILSSQIFPPISLNYVQDFTEFQCVQYAVGLSFGIMFSVILFNSRFYWFAAAASLIILGLWKDLSFWQSIALAVSQFMILLGSKFVHSQFSRIVSHRFARKIISKLTIATGASFLSAALSCGFFHWVHPSSGAFSWSIVARVALANFLGVLLVIPVIEYFIGESRDNLERSRLKSSFSEVIRFILAVILLIGLASYAESAFVLMPIVMAFFMLVVRREGNALGALFLVASFVVVVSIFNLRFDIVMPLKTNEVYLLYLFLALFQILLVSIRSSVVYEKVQSVIFVVSSVMCLWGLLEAKRFEQADIVAAKETISKVEGILDREFHIAKNFFQHFDKSVDTNEGLKHTLNDRGSAAIENFFLEKSLSYVVGVGLIQKTKNLPEGQGDLGYGEDEPPLWDRFRYRIIFHYPQQENNNLTDVDVSNSQTIVIALKKLDPGEITVIPGQSNAMIVYRSTVNAHKWIYMIIEPGKIMSGRSFYDQREISLIPVIGGEPVHLSRYVSSLKSPVGIEGKVELGHQTLRAWTSVEGRNQSVQQKSFILQALSLLIVLSILGVGFVTFEWFVDRDLLLERVQTERDTLEVQAAEQKLISQSLREMTVGAVHDINSRLAVLRGRATVIKRQIERKQIKIEDVPSQLEIINESVEGINKVLVGVRSLIWQSGGEDDFKLFSVAELVESLQSVSFERFKNHGIDFKIEVIFGEKLSDVKISGRKADLTKLFVHIFSELHDIVIQRPNSWIKL
ncbi:MAG TPA: hypothetical protein PLU50_02195, partial [Pseudobdellovibrionaceae bacterium]|nr:hypothetical protein [Pseudobdellovibrionaceae bacterium]